VLNTYLLDIVNHYSPKKRNPEFKTLIPEKSVEKPQQ